MVFILSIIAFIGLTLMIQPHFLLQIFQPQSVMLTKQKTMIRVIGMILSGVSLFFLISTDKIELKSEPFTSAQSIQEALEEKNVKKIEVQTENKKKLIPKESFHSFLAPIRSAEFRDDGEGISEFGDQNIIIITFKDENSLMIYRIGYGAFEIRVHNHLYMFDSQELEKKLFGSKIFRSDLRLNCLFLSSFFL